MDEKELAKELCKIWQDSSSFIPFEFIARYINLHFIPKEDVDRDYVKNEIIGHAVWGDSDRFCLVSKWLNNLLFEIKRLKEVEGKYNKIDFRKDVCMFAKDCPHSNKQEPQKDKREEASPPANEDNRSASSPLCEHEWVNDIYGASYKLNTEHCKKCGMPNPLLYKPDVPSKIDSWDVFDEGLMEDLINSLIDCVKFLMEREEK